MSQHNPSPTPWTGNAVLTANTITAVVAAFIVLVRAYGGSVTADQEVAILDVLRGPTGEVIVLAIGAVMTFLARSRVYSELSVKRLTQQERPVV